MSPASAWVANSTAMRQPRPSAIASRAALGGILAESTAVAQLTARQASTAEQAWSVARTRAVVLEKLEDRHRDAVEAEDLRLDHEAWSLFAEAEAAVASSLPR